MKIVTKSLTELMPADYNPRSISKEALRGLSASIKKFGLVEPIIWNKRTNRVVGGHQRLKVLKQQGIAETGVIVVDLDPSQEKALNVALNNPHIQGEFTRDLGALLDEIETDYGDLFQDLMLSCLDIPALRMKEVREKNFDVEDALRAIGEPKSKRGEIYTLGRHRLMCGDATNPEDVAQLLGGDKVDVVFTDPPFDLANDVWLNHLHVENGFVFIFCKDSQWQRVLSKIPSRYQLKRFFVLDIRFLEPGGIDAYNKHRLLGQFESGDIRRKKKTEDETEPEEIYRTHQLLGRFKAGKGKPLIRVNDGLTSIIPVNFRGNLHREEEWFHKHQKPLSLFNKLFPHFIGSHDVVLDLFGGSGTTLIACEMNDADARVLEFDPLFCDVIRERFEKLEQG